MCKMPVKDFAMQRCVMLSITLCINYRLMYILLMKMSVIFVTLL